MLFAMPPEKRSPEAGRGRIPTGPPSGTQVVVEPSYGLVTNTRYEATNLHRNHEPEFLLPGLGADHSIKARRRFGKEKFVSCKA